MEKRSDLTREFTVQNGKDAILERYFLEELYSAGIETKKAMVSLLVRLAYLNKPDEKGFTISLVMGQKEALFKELGMSERCFDRYMKTLSDAGFVSHGPYPKTWIAGTMIPTAEELDLKKLSLETVIDPETNKVKTNLHLFERVVKQGTRGKKEPAE